MANDFLYDEFPTFTEVVTWPDSQMLAEKEGFLDNCALINSIHGVEKYGSSAYRVNPKWYQKFINDELEDISAEEVSRIENELNIDWSFPYSESDDENDEEE